MQRKTIPHYILLKTEFLNIEMKNNYLFQILKIFPNIASGRKNFKFFENRVQKNIIITNKYFKKKRKVGSIILYKFLKNYNK